MTEAAPSKYGSAHDWAEIIQGIGQGAGSAMHGLSQAASSRKEAREAKRRTLANLLSQAMKRDRNLLKAKQEHGGEMRDYQSQIMQQVARNFAQGLGD